MPNMMCCLNASPHMLQYISFRDITCFYYCFITYCITHCIHNIMLHNIIIRLEFNERSIRQPMSTCYCILRSCGVGASYYQALDIRYPLCCAFVAESTAPGRVAVHRKLWQWHENQPRNSSDQPQPATATRERQ
jgi:hypothetical protein